MSVLAKDFVGTVESAYINKYGYIWGQSGALWTEAKQNSIVKKYHSDPEKYSDYRQAAQYGSKWIGHKVIDCSGLPYWALKFYGIDIYHGSNSIWRNNLSHKGKITKGMKLPIGAAIFTGSDSDHPHMGALTTDTCVTEAKGTIDGVVHTPLSNKKWKYWGLFKGVQYDFIPGEETETSAKPATPINDQPVVTIDQSVLRKGVKGEAVTLLQNLLLTAGEQLPKYGADGDFGNETLAAVKSFQRSHDLKVDGIVGPKTWAALMQYQKG